MHNSVCDAILCDHMSFHGDIIEFAVNMLQKAIKGNSSCEPINFSGTQIYHIYRNERDGKVNDR